MSPEYDFIKIRTLGKDLIPSFSQHISVWEYSSTIFGVNRDERTTFVEFQFLGR